MRKLLIPLGIIVGFFIILAIIFAPKYNQFVNLEEEVNQKEAQIETQLQRRGDPDSEPRKYGAGLCLP